MRLFGYLAILALGGCASARPAIETATAHATHWGAVQLHDKDANKVDWAAHGPRTTGKELNVLALSGGGADGAFGAGLLTGWTKTGTRPEFDVVTGVSTGALMATLAFLGREYDSELEASYTQVKSGDIFVSKGAGGLFGESMLDNAPLKARIAQIVDEKHLEKIAEEYKKGRRLYIATTNLDAGEMVIWDMGEIAESKEADRIGIFREILAASAAVPGFFPPGYIHIEDGDATGQMHVDGGVKVPVLLHPFMIEGKQKAKHVYVIVNGKLSLRSAESHVEANVLDISKKSIAELLRSLTYRTVYQDYVAAKHAHAKFHLAFIPDSENESKNSLEFDKKDMRRLYDLGQAAGIAQAFVTEPPRLDPVERVSEAGK